MTSDTKKARGLYPRGPLGGPVDGTTGPVSRSSRTMAGPPCHGARVGATRTNGTSMTTDQRNEP